MFFCTWEGWGVDAPEGAVANEGTCLLSSIHARLLKISTEIKCLYGQESSDRDGVDVDVVEGIGRFLVCRADVLERLALVADLPTVRDVAMERLPDELVNEEVVEVARFNFNAHRAEGCARVGEAVVHHLEGEGDGGGGCSEA